jgi:hypothetical protein
MYIASNLGLVKVMYVVTVHGDVGSILKIAGTYLIAPYILESLGL